MSNVVSYYEEEEEIEEEKLIQIMVFAHNIFFYEL